MDCYDRIKDLCDKNGIADKYLMERGGWSSDVMRKIYRDVLDDEKKKQTEIINNHFASLV